MAEHVSSTSSKVNSSDLKPLPSYMRGTSSKAGIPSSIPSTPSLRAVKAASSRFANSPSLKETTEHVERGLNLLETRLKTVKQFGTDPRDIDDPFASSSDEEPTTPTAELDYDALLREEREDVLRRHRESSIVFDYNPEKADHLVIKSSTNIKTGAERVVAKNNDAKTWIEKAKGLLELGFEEGAKDVLNEALKRRVEPVSLIKNAMEELFDEQVVTETSTPSRIPENGRVQLIQEMAKLLQSMSISPKTEIKKEMDFTPVKEETIKNHYSSHSPAVTLDVQGANLTVLTPVRAKPREQRVTGTKEVLTPVRRSLRTNENISTEINDLLENVDYAFVPNKALDSKPLQQKLRELVSKDKRSKTLGEYNAGTAEF